MKIYYRIESYGFRFYLEESEERKKIYYRIESIRKANPNPINNRNEDLL